MNNFFRSMITKACSICFIKFNSYPSQNRVFCSTLCKKKWQSQNQKGKFRNSIEKKCLICNKKFFIRVSHSSKKLCSLICMGRWRSKNILGNKSSNWKGGISPKLFNYGGGFTEELKVSVLNRDKYRCRFCDAKKNLHVHHWDLDKKNNKTNNLCTLCIVCHMRLHRVLESMV